LPFDRETCAQVCQVVGQRHALDEVLDRSARFKDVKQ
jgi:hypothetical protein